MDRFPDRSADDGDPVFGPDLFAEIYRREVGRCIATLVRIVGDVDLAEDSVAEAFVVAAEKWATGGIPPNPGGWIATTARNRAIDHLRRESTRDKRQRESGLHDEDDPSAGAGTAADELGDVRVVPDDQLRLIFLCCHPELEPEAQVALTLKLLGGLATAEVAAAFLVSEATMAQRLVRVKRKIRGKEFAYRIPDQSELPDRLVPVLATIYLMYNAGHTATDGESLVRPELLAESLRLARLLVELMPDEPEVVGLLGLLILSDARRPARLTADGEIVLLADQDRTLWDQGLIAEGHALVRACVQRNQPGVYQLQASVAAVHADARTAADTDWSQIVVIYDHLLTLQSTDIVALSRAIAVSEADGPAAGLAALEPLNLEGYRIFHAARAEFLIRLGRRVEATTSFDRAIELSTNEVERRHLATRRASIST